jgi:hypothetical protein
MQANAILKIDYLQERAVEACLKLKEKGGTAYWRGQSLSARMLEILAPLGYHQAQRIADTLGIDFDEQFSNEYEWERFHNQVADLKEQLERELQKVIQLPEGISFYLGYDHGGNFALFLRAEERKFSGQAEGMN